MNINKDYISKNNCYEGKNNPQYIVIHETDNWDVGANAYRHAKAQYNCNLTNSVHFYCGSDGVYQTLDIKNGAWAVGENKGYSNITNTNSINIEICVNADGDYNIARTNAIELTKYLLTQYQTLKVVRHNDASGKYCPRKMMDNPSLWTDFLQRVKNGGSAVDDLSAKIAVGKECVGDRCKELQEKLIQLGYNCGGYGADGSFGKYTYESLTAFQKDNKLTVDGKAGPITFGVLDKLIADKNKKCYIETGWFNSKAEAEAYLKKIVALGIYAQIKEY